MSTPYLSITLHEIQAEAVNESGWWPGNTAIELYQTWTLAELETIDGIEQARWARQGFSVRGGLRGYTRFHSGDSLTVVDPQITLAITPASLPADGSARQLRLDMHHWEQNDADATEKIRGLFSDVTLARLVAAWRESRGDHARALAALERWLDGNWKDVASLALASAAPAAAGVVASLDLLPLLEHVVRVAANREDRYFCMNRIVISLRRDGDELLWRVHGIGREPSEWRRGEGLQGMLMHVTDGDNENRLIARYRVRVIQ